MAISKWPGFYKSSAATADRYESKVGAAILTPRALENYRRYLGEVGLRVGAKISEKNRVFFMDNVGEGRGLEFLMVQLLHDFLMHGIKPPELRVIAFSPMRARVTQFSGKFLKCEQISFGNDHVDETIIQMDLHDAYSAFRFTPNFPAGLWHDWQVNPHERPYYTRAFEEQKALMKGLETLGLKLNPHNVVTH